MNGRRKLVQASVGVLAGILMLATPSLADKIHIQWSFDTSDWPPVPSVYDVPAWFGGATWSPIDLEQWTWMPYQGWVYYGYRTQVTVTVENTHRDDCTKDWWWQCMSISTYPVYEPVLDAETGTAIHTRERWLGVGGSVIAGALGTMTPQPGWERLTFDMSYGSILPHLEIITGGCPPVEPVPVNPTTWGRIKSRYR